jgi:3-deoxy-manno-octulosonate cytidylyltransferase (CMP-KDO synthetase)
MNKTIGIIPSRLESSRLHEKALVDICGYPMIIHVLKRSLLAKSLDEVYVATDSQKIKKVVENHNGKVILTSSHHLSGTDRIAEAAEKLGGEIIVNIQGDEALVNPNHIDKAVSVLHDNPSIPVSILVNEYEKTKISSDIKVVLNEFNDVMYFSREDIPSNSRTKTPPLLKVYHIVPFRRDFLIKYSKWEKGHLEKIEFNEYLRILEKGYKIRAVHVKSDAVSIDTENDLEFVRNKMVSDIFFKNHYLK